MTDDGISKEVRRLTDLGWTVEETDVDLPDGSSLHRTICTRGKIRMIYDIGISVPRVGIRVTLPRFEIQNRLGDWVEYVPTVEDVPMSNDTNKP